MEKRRTGRTEQEETKTNYKSDRKEPGELTRELDQGDRQRWQEERIVVRFRYIWNET